MALRVIRDLLEQNKTAIADYQANIDAAQAKVDELKLAKQTLVQDNADYKAFLDSRGG